MEKCCPPAFRFENVTHQLSPRLWSHLKGVKRFAVIALQPRLTGPLQNVVLMLQYYRLPMTILSVCEAHFTQQEGRVVFQTARLTDRG